MISWQVYKATFSFLQLDEKFRQTCYTRVHLTWLDVTMLLAVGLVAGQDSADCFVAEIEESLRFVAFGVDFAVVEISFGD